MGDFAQRPEVYVSAEQRTAVLALYERGLYLQAYHLAESIGSIQHWHGTEARILAGRLAGNLGSIRLADWHWVQAWRKDRNHPEALWFFARYLMMARGPLAAWQFAESRTFPADAPKELQSHWCSQKAGILAQLRDFDAAEDWLKKADAISTEPWTLMEWAPFYALQDRPEDAEAAARRALELRPWYRPAVQWVAHFLVQKERDHEAIDLLTEATQRLESGAVHAQLAALQIELKRYDDAAKNLDDYERLSPLLYRREKEGLDAFRCDLASRRGDYGQALELAQKLVAARARRPETVKYFANLVKQLTNRTEPGRRVELPVPFVRQHHKTCGPATLTCIAKFWSMPAEQVEVTEEIAYLGTPYHSERKWADEHGWFTKAFTVTWESAVALIDRGIPFTLATFEVSSGHLQAVIGYDTACRSLIIRDPGDRHKVEMPYDLMKERYASTGPRGIAMVPLNDKDRLADLSLPDEGLYDLVFQCDLARVAHRRAEAGQAFNAMAGQNPRHYLTLQAKRELAYYDADQPAGLLATEELLELFPDDQALQLARGDYLRLLGKRDERLALYQRLCDRKDSDPTCWQFYAQELSVDARNDTQTAYLLKKTIRATPSPAPLHGRVLDTLARLRWSQRRFDEALELSYFAVCGEDRDEYIAMNYFQYARTRGQGERALEGMRKRFARFGAQSNLPARTLYGACQQMGRLDEAIEVLDEAMRLRPKDGELLTYAAEAQIQKGNLDRAADILEAANGVSKPATRLRVLAQLAYAKGEPLTARDRLLEVIQIEPLAMDAHVKYCLTVAEHEGRTAVLRHLAAFCDRFPHHFGLNQLRLDWTYQDGPAAYESVLKKLIDAHPVDVVSRCDYAFFLAGQVRYDEALAKLDEAEPLDPNVPQVWSMRGLVFKFMNRAEDARHAFREAIRLNVDFEPAIQELVWLCDNMQQRRDVLAFVEKELLRQPTLGGGMRALVAAIQLGLAPEELLASERRVLDARPDLWLAWSGVGRQSGYARDFLDDLAAGEERYLSNSQKAVQVHPNVIDLWLDLAEAHRGVKNTEQEIQAAERAVELAFNSEYAVRVLSDAHERAGEHAQAKKVIEQAIARTPLFAVNYFHYAAYFWRRAEHDQAITQIEKCLKLDPWYQPAWGALGEWCAALHRHADLVRIAKEGTAKRPGDARSWLRLAQAYQWQEPLANSAEEKDRIEKCTAAYDEAIQRTPQDRNLHDLKAEMLGILGQFEEAHKACNPSAFKGKPPIELRRRDAWVYAQEGEFAKARERICATLKEDPSHANSWNLLLDWSFASQHFKDYLDAANEMLRTRPQSSAALTYRGEARLRMEEREAGMEDLKNAYRKDPCNGLAGFLLFDEQMVDDDIVGAEATLASLKHHIHGDQVAARHVQVLAKKESQTTALDIFKRMCTSTFPEPLALDMAMRSLNIANWKEPAEQILKDAMKAPNWNLHIAFLYAQNWNPNLANDLPDRIAAIDRALEKSPGDFRFLDLKAELLTNGHQFERARQVCNEKTLALDQYALEGRAAWIMQRSGRQGEAIEKMRAILKQHPKYIWGWRELADWYSRQANWVDVLTVGEQLVVLAPRDPVGFGWRGFAKQNLGDAQAARADYLHAIDLQPWYIWAVWQLFDMYVRNQEYQRAEKLLERSQKYADKGEWSRFKVDLLIYLNRKSSFSKEFENLLKHSEKAPWLIDQSLQFLIHVGWWSDAEEVMHRNLDLGAHVCDPWVRYRVGMGDRRVGNDVQNMSSNRPERTNCLAAYAIELAYAKDLPGLRQWILTHEDALRDDTPSWGKVGFALSVAQDWQGTVEWLSDWGDHPKALPAMLLPLIKAQRTLGRIEEARKVSLHCLTKLNGDFASAFHKVWLMYDQAMDGDLLPVQRYLDQADLGGFDGYHQMIAAMVRGLVAMMTDKEYGFAHAREILASTARFAPPTVRDPALVNAYQACVSHMAAQRGTWSAKLWRWWRWLMPTLPQVPKAPG